MNAAKRDQHDEPRRAAVKPSARLNPVITLCRLNWFYPATPDDFSAFPVRNRDIVHGRYPPHRVVPLQQIVVLRVLQPPFPFGLDGCSLTSTSRRNR